MPSDNRADSRYDAGRALEDRGDLDGAISAYELAARLKPDLLDAHYRLGGALLKRGNFDRAATAIQRVLKLRSGYAEAHLALGKIRQAQRKTEQAVSAYRQALSLKPDLTEARELLSAAIGQPAQSMTEPATGVDPRSESERGVQLAQRGDLSGAEACFRRALAALPGHPGLLINLANVLQAESRHWEAIEAYEGAIRADPAAALAWSNLGNSLQSLGRSQEAAAAHRRAVALQPGQGDFHNNLGIVLHKLGQLEGALISLRRAIALHPGAASYHNNLANVLRDLGQPDEAIEAYERAAALQPTNADFHNSLANCLHSQTRYRKAAESYRRAIAEEPRDPRFHNGLGNSLLALGEPEAALSEYREALAHMPDFFEAKSNLLLASHYLPDALPKTIFEEHLRVGRSYRPIQYTPDQQIDRNPERPLRVGYVSPDFREHSAGYFVEALLAWQSPGIEVFCYSDAASRDAVTHRLRQQVGHWRDTHGQSDDHLIQQIQQDGIDILVDLAGHTAGNRLQVFALKPAPVQVTYLGYPDTTGLSAIDYRISDSRADPVGLTDEFNTEKLLRLDPCAWCYRPPADVPDVAPLPAQKSGSITFGCFNNPAKLNEPLFELWSQVLHALPSSRLLLKSVGFTDPALSGKIRQSFQQHGIVRDRLEMLGRQTGVSSHLAQYASIDLALDTFPYHGTTTTCEALWMGVPVLTLAGKTHASRVGASLLSNVGLEELVTETKQQYVERAVQLANDLPKLADLRAGMRQRMMSSPLCDGPDFARRLGNAYREIWRQWCGATSNSHIAASSPSPQHVNSREQNEHGVELVREGDLAGAEKCFRNALAAESREPGILTNLASTLQALGSRDEALEHFRAAIELRPGEAVLHHNLAIALQAAGRYEEAAESFAKAISLPPDDAAFHNGLGSSLTSLGRHAEAIASYRRAMELRPDCTDAHSNLLLALHYNPGAEPEGIFQEHLNWARAHAKPFEARIQPHRNDRDKDRRLRVGFVSPDLRQHPVGSFLLPILSPHDREHFEMICYSDARAQDAVTQMLRQQSARWRDTAGLSDEQLAAMIRDDAVDILVDLAGHTAHNRLLVFARKPAPVQVSQFGYPDTTGLSTIDYRITDPFADPPGVTDSLYTEQLIRLPEAAWCWAPDPAAPNITPLPADSSGQITFGSLNNFAKLTPQALNLWAQILSKVPGSRLKLLACPPGYGERQVRSILEAAGVPAERLQTVGRVPIEQYLQHVSSIDIALDAFPYNGGVTTCDALWMGLSVVSLAGQTYVSRQGVSILSNIGLGELVASTPQEYAAVAAQLAQDLPRLASLREGMQSRLQASPVMDAPRFTRHLQDAYRQMWRRWCETIR